MTFILSWPLGPILFQIFSQATLLADGKPVALVEHCSSLAHISVYHRSIYKSATSLYSVTFQAVVRLKSGIQEAETAVAED